YRTPAAMPAWHATAPVWPSGGGDAVLANGRSSPAGRPGTAGAVRAGDLPVWVQSTSGSVGERAASPPSRVHVQVAARDTTRAAGVDAVVLAAASGDSGGAGDFTATSLKASGSWSAGGSSDAFTWSHPIPVPTVPGGLIPNVTLSYSSQAVDGLTSATNNQASLIGDGWDYSPGYVERSYQSCHENPAGPTRTWDTCWSPDNQLTLSLNGASTLLVKDDATGVYHPDNDANEKVEYLTGAANGAH